MKLIQQDLLRSHAPQRDSSARQDMAEGISWPSDRYDKVLKRFGPLLDQLGDFSKVRIKVEREKRHPTIDQEEINQAEPDFGSV